MQYGRADQLKKNPRVAGIAREGERRRQSTKVPIKLTSMNFEALTVRQPPVPIPGEGQMMVAVGPGGERQQVPADWHQYSNTPEESVRALRALPWHRAPLRAVFS